MLWEEMYDLVGFDVWTAHSVQTDAKHSYAQVNSKTVFGVTDVYFLALSLIHISEPTRPRLI
eukprot:3641802-Amphidinium_carterae.1